jgi:tetratricopeptide (TPR) repeat protein
VEPNNPVIRENLGDAYFGLARYEESILEFKKAIALQASNADLYTNLGEALFYLKRYPEALEYFEKSASMQPNDQEIIGNLADGYRAAEQQKKSIETYDRAIVLANKDLDVNPRDITVLGCLAVYHAKKGDISLAQYYMHRARAIDSSSPELLYNEAIILVLAKRPDSALASLRNAFARGISPQQALLEPEFNELQNSPAFQKLVAEFQEKQKHTN